MTEIRVQRLQRVLLAAILVASTAVLASEPFPGQAPDRQILKTQEKVDSLFEQAKYERALFIYRQELAPLGDKYAQYMVGYMHLAGKGVDEDIVTASAWYRLAAERRQDTFVRERDKLMSMLNDEQRARSDEAYIELRGKLGDAVLIAQLIENDLQRLRGRIKADPLSQNTIGRSYIDSRKTIQQQIAERIRARMNYFKRKLTADEFVNDAERRRYAELEERAFNELSDFEVSR